MTYGFLAGNKGHQLSEHTQKESNKLFIEYAQSSTT